MRTKVLFIVMFVCIFSIILFQHSLAEETSASGRTLTPLEKLLNTDGTINLNTGFSGSLDVRGWKMAMADNGQNQ